MFLTILGTGFNLLYWLKFKRRSFQSFKIPPSGQPHPTPHPPPPVLWTFWRLVRLNSRHPKGQNFVPTQVPDFMINYPSSKEKMFKCREKGMVYGLSVISIILTYSTMWNFIMLLCLATECNTFEWIIFVLHLQHWFMYYSIAVHAYSTDNNYFVKIARSALRLTELTIQAVKPKCPWVVWEGGLLKLRIDRCFSS